MPGTRASSHGAAGTANSPACRPAAIHTAPARPPDWPANRAAGQVLYEWRLVGPQGDVARCSNGTGVVLDAGLDEVPGMNGLPTARRDQRLCRTCDRVFNQRDTALAEGGDKAGAELAAPAGTRGRHPGRGLADRAQGGARAFLPAQPVQHRLCRRLLHVQTAADDDPLDAVAQSL